MPPLDKLLPGIVITLVYGCVLIPASWRIASRAGFKPAIALLMIISPINLILIVIFALKEWPIERELRLLKAERSERTG